MEKFAEIVQKRSTPGILIFDLDERLLYLNSEVLDIMPSLDGSRYEAELPVAGVPGEVLRLYRSVKEKLTEKDVELNSAIFRVEGEKTCSLRALPISQSGDAKNTTHIMILVEKIIEKHEPDFDKAKNMYNLSRKELEVLGLVCHGYSNKDIADRLFISVFTVKDHIKSMKRKMCASSRSVMVSLLK
jgi:DNA-binding CsgD family transcriptional regulator